MELTMYFIIKFDLYLRDIIYSLLDLSSFCCYK